MTTSRNVFALAIAFLGYLGVAHLAHGAELARDAAGGKHCTFQSLADGNTIVVCTKSR